MSNQGRVTISESTQERTTRVIETAGLSAEYSTGCTPTGEWFALGTIVRSSGSISTPAWVVVGTGTSVEQAIESLTEEIGVQARMLEPV